MEKTPYSAKSHEQESSDPQTREEEEGLPGLFLVGGLEQSVYKLRRKKKALKEATQVRHPLPWHHLAPPWGVFEGLGLSLVRSLG